MIAFQFLVFVQMEQLHLFVPALKSISASKRTAPQWQLPVYVFVITGLRMALGFRLSYYAVRLGHQAEDIRRTLEARPALLVVLDS
jgi:hypothetical protein